MVTTGAVEMTDAVLVVAEPIVVPAERQSSFKDCKVNNRKVSSFQSCLPVKPTLVLVRDIIGLTVIVVGVLLVTRLAVLGT